MCCYFSLFSLLVSPSPVFNTGLDLFQTKTCLFWPHTDLTRLKFKTIQIVCFFLINMFQCILIQLGTADYNALFTMYSEPQLLQTQYIDTLINKKHIVN